MHIFTVLRDHDTMALLFICIIVYALYVFDQYYIVKVRFLIIIPLMT